ncbi:CD226 antigen isoform X1 [Marmota marmota marmota]|uniref:CD226 antigen isoform X1 n=1 Tax=Marmota marmota marmota TaxID=9994 RepID=UPI0020927C56|nr:CD226 antigen isoform X1 [Marmota marmota marmota]XP_048662585.1 CD226 antigen isoform X1 [Marmota marmota marmota]XP_048662586.1 CD226 antigen isoform X1 [Marmota marmota marmota]XP_048662587.1 CD226 antigen isoform X1 [Marmota marmota marmota]
MHQPPKQFPEMDYLTFLLAILHVHKALCEETFWDTTIKFAENMTLECMYPSVDITQVEWFKIHDVQKSIGLLHPIYGVVIHEPYDKKLHLLNSTTAPNTVILSFYNASETDVGTYSCSFLTYTHGTWKKTIRVVQSDSFETDAPLNYHIVSESGKNVTLNCQLQMDGLVHQVTWEKIQPYQIDLLTCCNLSQGRSYTSKYPRQILSNCSQGSRSSWLLIPNATASDSGLYRCRFSARSGENETFVAKLTITDGQSPWSTHLMVQRGDTDGAKITNAVLLPCGGKADNQYLLFVAGGVVLLFVVAIVIIIVISCNRRRRRQKSTPFKESWDTKSKAANNYRSPFSITQPMEDTREDIYVNYPTFSRRPKPRV